MKREDMEAIVWEFDKSKTVTYKTLSKFGEAMIYYALIGDKDTQPILKCEINKILFDGSNDVPIYNLTPDEIKSFYLKDGFSSSSKFRLTDYGSNILYELKKERRNKRIKLIAKIVSVFFAIIGISVELWGS